MSGKKIHPPASSLNRRQFLKMLGLSGLSGFLAQCRSFQAASPTPTPSVLVDFPTPASPTLTATVVHVAAPSTTPVEERVYKAMVAIGQVENYDPVRLQETLGRMLDGIGGLGDLVKPGARVGIKPNLTGGIWWDADLPVPATELFVTHPALVGELVKLFYAAGAGKVTIMEGLGDERSFLQWGYTDMAQLVGADLVDLCKPDPYPSFKVFPVQPKFNIYDSFYLNPVLKDLDVFVSVAKMKCHATTGVTLSMKNLFGIAPLDFYKRNKTDTNRSAFHDTEAFDKRVPRIILDLNVARPIHLAIIDGVLTGEAGAGPWDASLSPVRPGLLVASQDPVAADAVATALMGFDPAGAPGTSPFTGGDNHLALAHAAGLGTNRLEEIGLIGPKIESVRFPFKPVN